MSVFSELLAKTGLPESVTAIIAEPLHRAVEKIESNNRRAQKVKASQAVADPNNHEHLDAAIKLNEDNDPVIAELDANITRWEEEITKLNEKREAAIQKAREAVKSQLKPPMSTEEIAKAKATFSEVSKEIDDSVMGQAETAYMMIAKMAAAAQGTNPPTVEEAKEALKAVLPAREVLTRGAGKKSSGGSDAVGSRITRTDAVLVNNELVFNLENGAKASRLTNAANKLSVMTNTKRFPQNEVTLAEIETAYYNSYTDESGKVLSTFRAGATMPVYHTFTFEKMIQVQNPNDDSTHEELFKAKIDVIRNVKSRDNIIEGNKAKEKFGLPTQEVPALPAGKAEEVKPDAQPEAKEEKPEASAPVSAEIEAETKSPAQTMTPAQAKLAQAKAKK